MKIYSLFLLILITPNLFGQTCKIKLAESPRLRGFYLGMKSVEIKKIFPSAEISKANELGYTKVTFSFFPLPDRYLSYGEDSAPNSIDTDKFKTFKGWQTAKFEFVDEKVVSMEIQYDSEIKWKNLAEFVKQFAEMSNLPAEWSLEKENGYFYYLDCEGFRIESNDSMQNPSVYFVDLEAPKILKQRKQEQEEKKKKGFKP